MRNSERSKERTPTSPDTKSYKNSRNTERNVRVFLGSRTSTPTNHSPAERYTPTPAGLTGDRSDGSVSSFTFVWAGYRIGRIRLRGLGKEPARRNA